MRAEGLCLLFCLLAACQAGGEGPSRAAIEGGAAPPRLSDFGFFTASGSPAEGVVAYDLVNPLFSDHALKERYVYVPSGVGAQYSPVEAFDFPEGSALIKTFVFPADMRAPGEGGRRIETRVLLRRAEGWVAYPYIWNDDQTDAVYSPVGGRKTISTILADGTPRLIDYRIPNQNQCKTCHQKGEEIVPIGPSARSLNHAGPFGVNQIDDWMSRGLLKDAPASQEAPGLVPVSDTAAPLEARARSWLDINCAHCHNGAGSASNSGLFLRWDEQDPGGWGVLKRPVAAGRGAGDNLFVIDPGSPGTSILVHRMASVEPGIAMPELGRTQPDPESVELISAWIASMPEARPAP